MNNYPFLLIVLSIISMPFSVTVHHALISLCTLIGIYLAVKIRRYPKTLLLTPLHIFNFATILSTALYMPEKLTYALKYSFLRYSYIFPHLIKLPSVEILNKISLVLVIQGYLLIPVFLYNLLVLDRYKLLWGNIFKVAEIYALFTLFSVGLFLQKRNIFYGISALIFFGTMIAPARRAEVLGLILTILLMVFLYIRYNKQYLKAGLAVLGSLIVLAVGGFLYLAEYKKDHRFVTAIRVIKGEVTLNDKVLNSLSSRRWDILKSGLKVIEKDISQKNIVHLLIGHGIYSGQKLDPPPPIRGLEFYESIVFVQEFIQRGFLGVIAMVFIFVRSLIFLVKLNLRKREDLVLLPFAAYLVFYNLSTVFTPYVNATMPIALFTFGIAEAYKYQTKVLEKMS